MTKILFLVALIFMLNSCVSSRNHIIETKFSDFNKINTYDSCTNFSYISSIDDVKYQKMFIEYISLDSSCKWNGLARGFFVNLFKDSLKVSSFELVQREEFSNTEISTYIIDKKYYVDIINQYGVFDDTLIIDYSGIYTNELLNQNGKTNLYLQNLRLDTNYSNSLVKWNFVNSYFTRERENSFE